MNGSEHRLLAFQLQNKDSRPSAESDQERKIPYKTCYSFRGRWVQQDVHGRATAAQEA